MQWRLAPPDHGPGRRLGPAWGLILASLCAGGCPSALPGASSTPPSAGSRGSSAAADAGHRIAPAPLGSSGPTATPLLSERYQTATIPGGLPCLIRLREQQIPFQSLEALSGVHTPVRITGPIGGVHFRALGKGSLRCDCRLALALLRAAPLLRQLGVEEVFFSNAYSYRRRQDGRLSQHAMGLALDVHQLKIRGRIYAVDKDYVSGREGCSPELPALNQLACLLQGSGAFDWVLTPDTDSAHADHFHLDLYCLYRRRMLAKGTPPLPEQD